MLTRGEMTLMLNTAYEDAERPAAPDPTRVRGHAGVSLYFACPDPDAVHVHLCGKGWDVNQPGHHELWHEAGGYQGPRRLRTLVYVSR